MADTGDAKQDGDTKKADGDKEAGDKGAGNAKEGLEELVKGIIGSIQSVSATEQAVHKQTESALQATTTAITDLIKNNAYSPELAQEALKMQKAMIERTTEIINALPMTMSTTASSKDKSGSK